MSEKLKETFKNIVSNKLTKFFVNDWKEDLSIKKEQLCKSAEQVNILSDALWDADEIDAARACKDAYRNLMVSLESLESVIKDLEKV